MGRSVPLVYARQGVCPKSSLCYVWSAHIITRGIVQDEIVPAGMYGRVVDITPRGGVVIEGQAALGTVVELVREIKLLVY